MEALSPTNPRRMYSWWWDSHICPKNSKWLQENLADMDSKIKLMIKIIEEDADSFAKRAEMYYRRRPELMTLLEELYRAYRALAERYDHAAGELRQAHRKMAEAFPDQVPPDLDDDLPAETAAADVPDMTPFFLSFINAAESKKPPADWERLQRENEELKKKASSALDEAARLREALADEAAAREAAVAQSRESSARLLGLESQISRTQEEFRRLQEEMHAGLETLGTADERCVVLEAANQDLHAELGKLRRASDEKHVELEKLCVSMQTEQLRSMQAEMARLSLEKQLAASQEKLRLLTLGKQGDDVSMAGLRSELDEAMEENRRLDDRNRASTATIVRLQDEVISLKNAQRQLEEQASRHAEEEKALRHELSRLRDDRREHERRHCSVTEQIHVVGLDVASLHALAREVRDGNAELKEIIRGHEGVGMLHGENLRQLERMSEKNARLEESLSAAATELEALRAGKAALEESCRHLSSRMASHQSERAVLVAQVEAVSQTIERLLEKNVLLENSLSDANAELNGLRTELQGLDESSQALHNQNAMLRSEKHALTREVECISECLLNLERRCAELDARRSEALDEVIKLQEMVRLERQENKELLEQIGLLQEDGRRREVRLEAEEHQIVEAQTEIFVLRESLRDTGRANADLSEKSRAHSKKLAGGIRSVLEVLQLQQKYNTLDDMSLDIVLQLVLHEIRCLLNAVSDAQDVKQGQLLEKSLVVTLLEHFGREVADLRSERNALKQEWQAKSEELQQLQGERRDLLRMSDEFWKEVEARDRRVDELKAEARFLVGQLSELQESRRSLQAEIIKLIKENSSLSNKLVDVKEKESAFEDSFSALIGEAVSADILNVVLMNLHDETASQLGSLREAGAELHQEIRHLERELSRAMSAGDRSSVETPTGKRRLARRDRELLRAGGKKAQPEQAMHVERCKECNGNAGLREELHKLQSEVEALRSREKAASPSPVVVDVKSCDVEMGNLLRNMQMAIMSAALFKEKVLELIVTCESFEISTMVQKEVLKEEITRRNSYVDELKDKLNAVEVENRRLKVDLNGEFTLLGSLQSEVDALERQTLSLAKDCLPANKPKNEENALLPHLPRIAVKPSDDESTATKVVKDMELQKLHGTIKALQTVVTDTGVLLEQERLDFGANLADARKQIEALKLKEILDGDLSDVSYEQMMKDIQLDLVQASSGRGHRLGSFRQREKKQTADGGDTVLNFWGVVGAGNAGGDRAPEHDLRPPQSEAADPGVKPKRPSSELMVVKELSIDKQELPPPRPAVSSEPHREWKQKVIDRLSSDAQRLAVLQASIRELKSSAEASEQDDELEGARAQIREAEEAVAQLLEANTKLSKKAEEFTSADSLDGDNVDLRSRSQRKILERARKASEKIGRLELELQKLQQTMLRFEEEQAGRRAAAAAKVVQRRSKVQLVEYLYGRRRDSRRPKRASPCGCMRAKAVED